MSIFDIKVDRRNTNCVKWDEARQDELPMWVADMDFLAAPSIRKAIIDKANVGAYGYSYTPIEYFLAYQSWWQRRHNVYMDTDWMMFSTGVVPAISSIVRKITTPAENVLILSPVYNIFYNSIYNNGRNILCSNLVYKNGNYEVDYVDLEEKLKNPQTTLMILCNPHNPIGHIWSKEELEKIGKLAYENNCIVLSDEIHCDIVKPGLEYTPFLSVNEECKNNSITCISASKCFNLAGLQSACVDVPNKNLRHKVNRGLNTDEVAENNFFAVEATIAALNDSEDYLDELNLYIEENKKIVASFIKDNDLKLTFTKPDATYLMWIDFSYYTNDTDNLQAYLRKNALLYLSKGSSYGNNGNLFLRMNLATQKENVIEGLNRLKKGLEMYKNIDL